MGIKKQDTLKAFDYIRSITKKKQKFDFMDPKVSKGYSPYTISKFLSDCEMYLPIVNRINTIRNTNIPNDCHYEYLFDAIPNRFIKLAFPKADKDKQTNLKYIAYHYQVGMHDADIYLKRMTDEQLNEILDNYREGKGNKLIPLDKLLKEL